LPSFNLLNGFSSQSSQINIKTRPPQPPSGKKVTFDTQINTNKDKCLSSIPQRKHDLLILNSNDARDQHKRYSSSCLDCPKRIIKSIIGGGQHFKSNSINRNLSNATTDKTRVYSSDFDFTHSNIENSNSNTNTVVDTVILPPRLVEDKCTNNLFINEQESTASCRVLSKPRRLESVREAFPLSTNIGGQSNNNKQTVGHNYFHLYTLTVLKKKFFSIKKVHD
jgi:hypothetical protein